MHFTLFEISQNDASFSCVFPIINRYFCHTLKMFNDEIVNNGRETHEKLMSAACLFTIKNCQIVCSCSLTQTINYKFMSLSAY